MVLLRQQDDFAVVAAGFEVTGEFIDAVVTQWLAALGHRYDHCG